MDFKKEFQSEMQKLSPTDEQLERIKKGVERKLAEPPAPKKKTISLKAAAITMGSVCAAAVTLFVLLNVNIYNESMSGGMNAASPNNSSTAGGIYWEMSGNKSTDGNACASEPSFDNTGSAPSSTPESLNDPNGFDSASKGAITSPSLGDSSKSEDCDITYISETPVLTFSEDEEQCNVILNGREYDYELLSDKFGSSDDLGGEEFTPASNNLGEELFVRFGENTMTVFSKNGKFYKQYILK